MFSMNGDNLLVEFSVFLLSLIADKDFECKTTGTRHDNTNGQMLLHVGHMGILQYWTSCSFSGHLKLTFTYIELFEWPNKQYILTHQIAYFVACILCVASRMVMGQHTVHIFLRNYWLVDS